MSPDQIKAFMEANGNIEMNSIIMVTYPTVRNDIAFDASGDVGDYDIAARLAAHLGPETIIEEMSKLSMATMVNLCKRCKTQQSLDLVIAGARKARVTLAPK